jgi:magnesium chelatase accessory protein
MMAVWDPRPLARDLPRLRTPLELVVAEGDRMILPAMADEVRALVPHARLHRLPRLGHLAHEEEPATVAALIRACAAAT